MDLVTSLPPDTHTWTQSRLSVLKNTPANADFSQRVHGLAGSPSGRAEPGTPVSLSDTVHFFFIFAFFSSDKIISRPVINIVNLFRRRETHRDLLSAGFLPKGYSSQKWARSFLQVSHLGAGAKDLGPSPLLPHTVSRFAGSEVEQLRYKRDLHWMPMLRWKISLLSHCTGPSDLFLPRAQNSCWTSDFFILVFRLHQWRFFCSLFYHLFFTSLMFSAIILISFDLLD